MANATQRALDTRVEVIEHDIRGMKDGMGKLETGQNSVLQSMSQMKDMLTSQPKHTPYKEVITTIAVTLGVITGVITMATSWLNGNLTADRQNLSAIYRQVDDLKVLRYRVDLLEGRAKQFVTAPAQ